MTLREDIENSNNLGYLYDYTMSYETEFEHCVEAHAPFAIAACQDAAMVKSYSHALSKFEDKHKATLPYLTAETNVQKARIAFEYDFKLHPDYKRFLEIRKRYLLQYSELELILMYKPSN